jgi:hypothetical protein
MTAFYALFGVENLLRFLLNTFRVMTPFARKGASLKKNRRSNPRPVMNAIAHNVKDYSLVQ